MSLFSSVLPPFLLNPTHTIRSAVNSAVEFFDTFTVFSSIVSFKAFEILSIIQQGTDLIEPLADMLEMGFGV